MRRCWMSKNLRIILRNTSEADKHAYLVEPHWNPTLEEQALAWIHRLGQSRQVTTVRLCVRNSFEEAS
ncbi:unnamed protein product [Colletotrichum noveboracense]|uniref:Uncharacterized protein n=1 Tax=Colletotrichum noveboracense TaxID=2664923 RepID=A0A9W4WKV8_9PEZI|nr:unnamed protein product [Colletotrichum noveboracense]